MKYNPFRAKDYFKTKDVENEVIPHCYVYQLDFTGGIYKLNNEDVNYKRLNNAKKGLYGKDMGNEGVWVNVYHPNPYRWFPITLDLWDYLSDSSDSEKLLGFYDV